MFRISTYAALLGCDPRDAIPACARLAVDGVVLDMAFGDFRLDELSGSGVREFRRLVTSNRLDLVAVRQTLPKSGLLARDPEPALDAIRRGLATTRNLDGQLLLVDLLQLPNPIASEKAVAKATPELAGKLVLPDTIPPTPTIASGDPNEIATIDHLLKAVGALADRVDVQVAFCASLSSFAALDRAVRAADCGHFRVELDPVAALTDPWTLERIFDAVGASIAHVRLRDAKVGSSGKVVPCRIGEGAVQLQRLGTLLSEAGYAAYVSIDATDAQDRASAVRDAVLHLRRQHL